MLLFISYEATTSTTMQEKQDSGVGKLVAVIEVVVCCTHGKSKHIGLDATTDRTQRPFERPQNGKCPRLIGRKLR